MKAIRCGFVFIQAILALSSLSTAAQAGEFRFQKTDHLCTRVVSATAGAPMLTSFCGDFNEGFSWNLGSSGFYTISPQANSAICLQANGSGAAVSFAACGGGVAQNWTAFQTADGLYNLKTTDEQFCLTEPANYSKAPLSVAACDGSMGQEIYPGYVLAPEAAAAATTTAGGVLSSGTGASSSPGSSVLGGTSTDTAVSSDPASDAGTTQKIIGVGQVASGSQDDSIVASKSTLTLGANQTATTGALLCATGAVQASSGDSAGAGDSIHACQDKFTAATAMNEMLGQLGNSAGFTADASVMAQEASKATLSQFSSKFGIEGDEYMQRMLGTKGSEGEFTDILKSKLSDSQVSAAMAAASNASTLASNDTVVSAASKGSTYEPAAAAMKRSSLRKQLGRYLASGATAKKGAAEEFTPTAKSLLSGSRLKQDPKLASLAPQGNEFAELADAEGLSLFEVVHGKYKRLAPGLSGQ